jgi:hypothetical protein
MFRHGHDHRRRPSGRIHVPRGTRRKTDSGWRFFAGTEEQEYVDDPDNLQIYDVNTVANYDPDIIPFLRSPVGSAFERDASGKFVAVP